MTLNNSSSVNFVIVSSFFEMLGQLLSNYTLFETLPDVRASNGKVSFIFVPRIAMAEAVQMLLALSIRLDARAAKERLGQQICMTSVMSPSQRRCDRRENAPALAGKFGITAINTSDVQVRVFTVSWLAALPSAMHENTRRGLIGVSERPTGGSAGLPGKIGSLRSRTISCLRWAPSQAIYLKYSSPPPKALPLLFITHHPNRFDPTFSTFVYTPVAASLPTIAINSLQQLSSPPVTVNIRCQLSPSTIATMPARQTANIPARAEQQCDGISIRTLTGLYVDP